MKNKFIAALALGAAILSSCNNKQETDIVLSSDEKALKSVVEQYVPNVIYTIYGSLADETENLVQKLTALRDGGNAITQAQVDDACATFLLAREYWEKSEAFLFGAATAFGIDPHIDSWPLNKAKLATSLSNPNTIKALKEDGTDAIDLVGASSLGFHGIEFILFRDGKNRTAEALKGNETDAAFASVTVSGQDELVFATAVAEDLYNACAQLEVSWNPDAPTARKQLIEDLEYNCTVEGSDLTYGENLLKAAQAGSTYGTWQEAVAKTILHGSAGIADEVANTKMGTAHYVSGSNYDKDYIESPYSYRSFYDFRDNILSIQYSLYGANNASTPKSASVMTFLTSKGYSGAKSLEDSLKAALKSLQDCISTGKAFVEDPTASYVEEAIEKVNDLNDELTAAEDWITKL